MIFSLHTFTYCNLHANDTVRSKVVEGSVDRLFKTRSWRADSLCWWLREKSCPLWHLLWGFPTSEHERYEKGEELRGSRMRVLAHFDREIFWGQVTLSSEVTCLQNISRSKWVILAFAIDYTFPFYLIHLDLIRSRIIDIRSFGGFRHQVFKFLHLQVNSHLYCNATYIWATLLRDKFTNYIWLVYLSESLCRHDSLYK